MGMAMLSNCVHVDTVPALLGCHLQKIEVCYALLKSKSTEEVVDEGEHLTKILPLPDVYPEHF